MTDGTFIETIKVPNLAHVYKFQNDWGNQTTTVTTTATTKRVAFTIDVLGLPPSIATVVVHSTLDFSAVTDNLVYVIEKDGKVTVTSSKGDKVTAEGIANITGGQGDNTYQFVGVDAKLTSLTAGSGNNAGRQNILDYSKYGKRSMPI